MKRIELHRNRGRWAFTIHWADRSERGGVWLYRWALNTPWFFIGWRSQTYDRMFT